MFKKIWGGGGGGGGRAKPSLPHALTLCLSHTERKVIYSKIIISGDVPLS